MHSQKTKRGNLISDLILFLLSLPLFIKIHNVYGITETKNYTVASTPCKFIYVINLLYYLLIIIYG